MFLKMEQKLLFSTLVGFGRISDKDFPVGLVIKDNPEFNPTHIRLLIDLYIKKESNPEDFQKLFEVFEKMFRGGDPVKLKNEVKNLNFPMHLDSSETNLYYAQLLMIEQDVNYGPGSKNQVNAILHEIF